MTPLTAAAASRPLVLDPAAEALLFTEARTANTFSDVPVDRLPRLDYDDVVLDV